MPIVVADVSVAALRRKMRRVGLAADMPGLAFNDGPGGNAVVVVDATSAEAVRLMNHLIRHDLARPA
jgi:hypothetical protein